MKKIFALAIAVVMLCTALTVSAWAASFDYARLTAAGNDPYGQLQLSSSIDLDTVQWAAIKYRTITQYDSTGVELIGQIYASPAAEPFIPVIYNHTQNWETVIVDLTSVSAKTTSASIWNTAAGKDDYQIRFDPMESNRDAEVNDTEDPAVVSDGDQIDIAYIAFFDSKEKAEAFDGTSATYAAIIDAATLATISGNNIAGEVLTETVADVAEVTETAAPAAADEAPAETAAPAAEVTTPVAAQTSDILSVAVAAVVTLGLAIVAGKKR